jgi:ribonucleoside-diphosphate reductase alpha chain
MKEINVIKRDVKKTPLDISKIQRQVRNCCYGISNVSESMIEIKSQLELYNNIKTTVIDELLLKSNGQFN